MKLWFVEPRANIFISGIKANVAQKVVDFLLEYCPAESGMLIFQKIPEAPGYRIYGRGDHKREIILLGGLQLVRDKDSSNH